MVQLTNWKSAGYQVQPGFSGGPVWDRQLKKVVGIIVTIDVDPAPRTSFLIPTRLLSAVYGKLDESILSPTQDLITSEDHDSLSHSGPHTIVIKAIPDGKLLWKGGIGPARIGDLWRGRTNYEIAYEPALTRYRGVVDALLRVAIHGAGGSLYVSEPDRWKERAKLAINSCLGTRWDHVSPAVGPANDDAWGLLPYCDYQDCEVPFERQYAPDELETIIHAKLDFSLLDGIRDAACRALQDRDFTQLGLDIEEDLARSMWDVWQAWEATLRAEPELLGHFFRVTLSKAASNQHRFARIRAGLRTLIPCLLRGVIFALAIRVCLPKEFHPALGHEYENLRASDGMGHLCGLELIEAITIVQRVGTLAWGTNYVLLPHYTDMGADIPELSKSLLTVGSSHARFDDPQQVSPLFLTNEGAFSRALAVGADALRDHLMRVVARWQARQEAEITRAIGEAANGF